MVVDSDNDEEGEKEAHDKDEVYEGPELCLYGLLSAPDNTEEARALMDSGDLDVC